MRTRLAAVVLCTVSTLPAQQDEVVPRRWSERIRAGELFGDVQYRRGADGRIEVRVGDASDDPQNVPFAPLLSAEAGLAPWLENCGIAGWLSLLCHGDGDLLAMTDAEWHLRAVGAGTSDVELRQALVVPFPAGPELAVRAQLLDRMLAIDVLRRRGCRQALGELQQVAADAGAPAMLRARAQTAVASLRGEPLPPRTRLDPTQLELPIAYDAALVIDHARLPDFTWWTAAGRRLGMLVTARTLDQVADPVSEAMLLQAQQISDQLCELPFAIVHEFGNARLDHSCLLVTVRADANLPVSALWQAAGAFEQPGLDRAVAAVAGAIADSPMAAAKLAIGAQRASFCSDGSGGKPRPALARELLADTGAAIRLLVPASSRLWALMAMAKLPPATGGDLRVAFADECTIELRITARDEDAAAAWIERVQEVIAAVRKETPYEIRTMVEANAVVRDVLAAALGAELAVDGAVATATIHLRDLDRTRLVEALVALLGGQ